MKKLIAALIATLACNAALANSANDAAFDKAVFTTKSASQAIAAIKANKDLTPAVQSCEIKMVSTMANGINTNNYVIHAAQLHAVCALQTM